jgi:hypothetical protein
MNSSSCHVHISVPMPRAVISSFSPVKPPETLPVNYVNRSIGHILSKLSFRRKDPAWKQETKPVLLDVSLFWVFYCKLQKINAERESCLKPSVRPHVLPSTLLNVRLNHVLRLQSSSKLILICVIPTDRQQNINYHKLGTGLLLANCQLSFGWNHSNTIWSLLHKEEQNKFNF